MPVKKKVVKKKTASKTGGGLAKFQRFINTALKKETSKVKTLEKELASAKKKKASAKKTAIKKYEKTKKC